MTDNVERLRKLAHSRMSTKEADIEIESAFEIERLRGELAAATRSLSAAKAVIEAKERQQTAMHEQVAQLKEARNTLQSEREANARLTGELAASQARESALRKELGTWVADDDVSAAEWLGTYFPKADHTALVQCLAQERERCAKVCQQIAADRRALYKGRTPYTGSEDGRADPHTDGESDGTEMCADAIRELGDAE